MKKIADISKYQGTVDWEKAANELSFCILRASCGLNKDVNYDRNASECNRLGIPFHAYHYLKATDFDGAADEADMFYKSTSECPPLFYVIDCEYSGLTTCEKKSAGTAKTVVDAFIRKLKECSGESIPIAVYIGHHLYKVWKLDYKSFAYVWIPRYGKNSGDPEAKPDYDCDLWQYTSKGTLAGVKSRVDLNKIIGDKPLSFFTAHPEDDQEGDVTMSYDPKKVIDIALAEVGYLEKKSAANLDDKTANAGSANYTKYARDLDALNFYNGRKQSVAWCDVFVDWCFVQAFGKADALKLTFQPTKASSNSGAGCKYSRGYYKNNGHLFDKPQAGDQIFFYPKDGIGGTTIQHTGLVYDVDGTYVYTVEGNTSGANGVVANGGGVCKKKYKLTYNRLAGFGRPDYGVEASLPDVAEDPDELKSGDKGSAVTKLQENLVALGYNLGTYGEKKNGVDGEFGSKTETALKAFQTASGLTASGTYNAETRAAITEAVSKLNSETDSETIANPELPTGTKVITITAKSVNARVGDSTTYDSVGQLAKGTVLEYVATAPNGWFAGRYEKRIVWVSNKYSTVS